MSVAIGVVPALADVTRTFAMWDLGWSFQIGTSTFRKCQRSEYFGGKYGRKVVAGDVVTCHVDFTTGSGTLSFDVNGKSQGTAFTDIPGPVRAAVDLAGFAAAELV